MDITHDKRRNGGRDDARILASTSLAEELGFKEDFAPDWMAPPVDRELVREFVRNRLHGIDRDQVTDLISGFRPWRQALQDVLREEAKRPDLSADGAGE